MKPVRDGGLFAGLGTLVTGLLLTHGLDAYYAVPAGAAVAGLAAWAYRALRARWPWLAALDPAGGAQRP